MKNFLYYWLPVYLYASLIFYFSSLPAIPPIIIKIIPEVLIWHMIEYAILSMLLFRAFINSRNTTLKENAVYLSILITILYGITDEIHQHFVPGRTFSYLDIAADGMGSIVFMISKYFKRQSKIRSSL